jgi:hypothetical protein
MIAFRSAVVKSIKKSRNGIQEIFVDSGDGSDQKPGQNVWQKAICYTAMIGPVEPGDSVIINTTAVDLGLGTGGYHFVVWNLSRVGCDRQYKSANYEADAESPASEYIESKGISHFAYIAGEDASKSVELGGIEDKTLRESGQSAIAAQNAAQEDAQNTVQEETVRSDAGQECAKKTPGHIMKLRYTPLQLKCLSVEEEDSPFHEILKDKIDIDGMPVIVGTLHSQLPAIAVTAKELKNDVRIAYIMTDGAALPIAFSNIVAELKDKDLIDNTITAGHAFGGDFEAVNIYSALVAAKYAAKADFAIVCMGPGIVGTNTALGFTGIEQGQIINAVNSLGGKAIAIPRISFADKRSRHYGISHHSITALTLAATTKATIVLPEMDEEKTRHVAGQIDESGLALAHEIVTVNAKMVIESLEKHKIFPTTMGRGIEEEAEFFKAAGVAAIFVLRDK